MSDKTVAQKARVKPRTRVAVVNPVQEVVDSLGLVEPMFGDVADAQIVFLFAHTRDALAELLPSIVESLAPGASVWVFFRKGSKAAGLDLNRDDAWAMAERLDLRPLGLVGVDDTWTAFRLRPASA